MRRMKMTGKKRIRKMEERAGCARSSGGSLVDSVNRKLNRSCGFESFGCGFV
jgi:hypothetical protein